MIKKFNLKRLLLVIALLRNVGANFLRRGQLSKLAPFYELAPKELPFSAYTMPESLGITMTRQEKAVASTGRTRPVKERPKLGKAHLWLAMAKIKLFNHEGCHVHMQV